jgi:hypothetical protein
MKKRSCVKHRPRLVFWILLSLTVLVAGSLPFIIIVVAERSNNIWVTIIATILIIAPIFLPSGGRRK